MLAADPSILDTCIPNVHLGTKGGLGVFLIGKGSAFDRAVPVIRELDIDSDRGPQVQDASS